MEKLQAIIDVLTKNGVKFTDSDIQAMQKAFSTRGAYKGYLKKNKPNGNKEPLAAAAWLAMQPNAYKIGMIALFMMRDEERALFDKLSKLPNGETIKYPAMLDKDMESLKKMGVW